MLYALFGKIFVKLLRTFEVTLQGQSPDIVESCDIQGISY